MENISAVNSSVMAQPSAVNPAGNAIPVREWFGMVVELAKVRITVAVSLTTLTGFLFAGGGSLSVLTYAIVGIFLLACGSSVLNHLQEKSTDAQMYRTQHRPLASGRFSVRSAAFLAAALSVSGAALLYFGVNLNALLLGLFALVWYNGVYTPLKRVTAYAVIPGSLIGAIPPIVGWAAATGAVFETQILMVALFFFVWQIPHFWLLLLRYGQDYERAGFPTLTRLHNHARIQKITMVWIWIMAASAVLIPLLGITETMVSGVGIALATTWYVFTAYAIFRRSGDSISVRKLFLKINIYALVLMVFLSLDPFLGF